MSAGAPRYEGGRTRPEHLLVVSHVVHYRHAGAWHAYGPYARELELWAGLFDRLTVAAPVREEAPPGDCIALRAPRLALAPQPETGGATMRAKLVQIARLPRSLWTLARSMARADAIHVRCPGNIGLLGAVLAPLFSTRLVAKYAGQWQRRPGEPSSVRLQRAILRSPWWRGPVLVYGGSTGERAHIVPFFSTALDAAQMTRARAAAERARPDGPLRLLFVGRLSREKNAGVVIEAVARLRRAGIETSATIVGDGPARAELVSRARALGVEDRVSMAGAVPHEHVLVSYESADVAILLSETEGWPKAIAEAMAFGLICIGSDCGVVRSMLSDGRGLVLDSRDAAALADLLRPIAETPGRYDEMRQRAARWSQQFTREAFQAALGEVLERHWDSRTRPALRAAHV